jgi:hypothetical protein
LLFLSTCTHRKICHSSNLSFRTSKESRTQSTYACVCLSRAPVTSRDGGNRRREAGVSRQLVDRPFAGAGSYDHQRRGLRAYPFGSSTGRLLEERHRKPVTSRRQLLPAGNLKALSTARFAREKLQQCLRGRALFDSIRQQQNSCLTILRLPCAQKVVGSSQSKNVISVSWRSYFRF